MQLGVLTGNRHRSLRVIEVDAEIISSLLLRLPHLWLWCLRSLTHLRLLHRQHILHELHLHLHELLHLLLPGIHHGLLRHLRHHSHLTHAVPLAVEHISLPLLHERPLQILGTSRQLRCQRRWCVI